MIEEVLDDEDGAEVGADVSQHAPTATGGAAGGAAGGLTTNGVAANGASGGAGCGAAASSAAPYPTSFAEVMTMMKEGREADLPGIKQIPNQLSVDAANPSPSVLPKPVYPWEKNDAANGVTGANGAVAADGKLTNGDGAAGAAKSVVDTGGMETTGEKA